MGGLINGSMVKGDLWTIDGSPNSPMCSAVATMAEGPGPRVGHAALLVGNAFIVFGGDTKVDENDELDNTLYLLNTCMTRFYRLHIMTDQLIIPQLRSTGPVLCLPDTSLPVVTDIR